MKNTVLLLAAFFLSGFSVCAQSQLFSVPANKAYAEPFEENRREVGVRIPVGYPETVADVSGWTNKDRSVVWRLYQQPGTYSMNIEYTLDKEKNLDFDLHIEACYDGLDFHPMDKSLNLLGTGELDHSSELNIRITKAGYYAYRLTPKSDPDNAIRIHQLHFRSSDPEAQVNHTDYQSSPSVHINFSSTAENSGQFNWLYEDVMVRKGADPLHTFYMAIGFYRGYLGIQTNSPTERRVLFSVWDSKDAENDESMQQDDFVRLIDKDELTTTNSFGGEGTGGQSYVKSANWKTAERVSFIMNALPREDNSVILSAWYKLAGQDDWNYIASWRAPKEQRYFNGFHSFLENYGYTNGQMRRMAEYYNAYGYDIQKQQWIPFNKVSFSHTDGEKGQRVDYEQGVSPFHSERFYMSSGGYTPTVLSADEIPLSDQVPEVDLKKLERRVLQALKNAEQREK